MVEVVVVVKAVERGTRRRRIKRIAIRKQEEESTIERGWCFDGPHRRTLRLFETTKTRRHPLYRIRFPGNHLLLLEAIARHNGQVIHPLRLLARETTIARGWHSSSPSPPLARFPHATRQRKTNTHLHPPRSVHLSASRLMHNTDVYLLRELLCAARLFRATR